MNNLVTTGMKNGEEVKLPEIDIKSRKTPDSFFLNLNNLTENDLKTLSFLKEILSKHNINLEVTHYVSSDTTEWDNVFISYERNEMLEKTTRNAGRKKDFTMNERYKNCTISELKIKLESGMKKSDIIAELGCPRSTFYRILKNIENINVYKMGEDSIWLYTN